MCFYQFNNWLDKKNIVIDVKKFIIRIIIFTFILLSTYFLYTLKSDTKNGIDVDCNTLSKKSKQIVLDGEMNHYYESIKFLRKINFKDVKSCVIFTSVDNFSKFGFYNYPSYLTTYYMTNYHVYSYFALYMTMLFTLLFYAFFESSAILTALFASSVYIGFLFINYAIIVMPLCEVALEIF